MGVFTRLRLASFVRDQRGSPKQNLLLGAAWEAETCRMSLGLFEAFFGWNVATTASANRFNEPLLMVKEKELLREG